MGSSGPSFSLDIYPYFYETTADAASDTFTAVTPGGVETGTPFRMDTAASGWIKIIAADKSTSTLHQYGSISGSGTDTVTFSGVSPVPALTNSGAAVLPVVLSTGSVQSGVGGSTPLNIATSTDITDIFPKYNGAFKVDGDDTVYLYEERDDTGNALTGITEALGSNAVSMTVAASTKIVLEKFIKLKSIGSFANTSNEIIYSMPFPESFQEVEFHDHFDSALNWDTTNALGTFSAGVAGGDNALKVEGTVSGVGGPRAAQIEFDWSTTDVDFGSAWRYGNATYLNYDAQVKVGFETTATPPVHGYDPSPIPKYFVAGMNVRMEDLDNSYGIAFMRANNTVTFPGFDNIENNLVSVDDQLQLVLWQQTGSSGSDIAWLAYKELQPVFYSHNVEIPWFAWTGSIHEKEIPAWYTTTSAGQWRRISTVSYSPTRSFHTSLTGNYINNMNARLFTDPLDLSNTDTGIISFWHRYEMEPGNNDYGVVQISNNNGSSWTTISPSYSGTLASWTQVEIDISDYLPASMVLIGFRMVSNATLTYDGWYIDDVKIYKDIPIQEATILTHVRETMSFSFKNGYDTSGTGLEVEDGDWITDGSNVAYVDGDPILVGGEWDNSGDKAEGVIKIRNANNCFSSGTGNLQVIGKSGLTGDVLECSDRDNFIQVFYGDTDGYGTANDDPFDDEKRANPRGSTYWPEDELNNWEAATDYFSAVEWDVHNTDTATYSIPTHIAWDAAVTANTFSMISSEVKGQLRDKNIIRINTLSSPTSGSFTQPELGLHAFGRGAENVYFDDFGVKLSVGSEREFAPAIQE